MLKIDTKLTHWVDCDDWDRYISKKFPNCKYPGIVEREELGNHSYISTNTSTSTKMSDTLIEKIKKYLDGVPEPSDRPSYYYSSISTVDIIRYLALIDLLPEGKYVIEIWW